MNAICIFLGSSNGHDPAYARVTRALGHELAAQGLTCVYGGSRTGLMNHLADSVLEAGGKVIGVTVQALKDRENFHQGLTELHVLPTMHERKNLMVELADGFISLPGGIGTFEEFLEVYTLGQMGFHRKPCGLLDINDYYQPLLQLLENALQEGFLKTPYQQAIFHSESPVEIVNLLQQARPGRANR